MGFFYRSIVVFLLCVPILGQTQGFSLPKTQKHQKIKFELINNLIVVPVEINGAELSFVLDSGVSKPILFNITAQDSIQINDVSEITIQGLGSGDPIKALRSRHNIFKVGKAANFDQELYVVLDKDINFSTFLGKTVHGIIGYDLFRDFIVDMNYGSRTIKLYAPESYTQKQHKKAVTLPLDVMNRKAYINGNIIMHEAKNIPVKLLVDTGSSDALWLFQNAKKGLEIPQKHYEDFLGKGLNGNIFGKRTKISGVDIGGFELKNAKAAFPYREFFRTIGNMGDRNGSVGGEILKRFNIVFDYSHGKITLRKNGNFNTPFQYNLAGIDLQHNGLRYISERITDANGIVRSSEKESTFGNVQILLQDRTRLSLVPEIIVSGIRAGSPAAEAGLKEGDVILAVNGRRVHRYKLQEILKLLNEKEGKRVRVLIERYNRDMMFSFVLKNVFD